MTIENQVGQVPDLPSVLWDGQPSFKTALRYRLYRTPTVMEGISS
jgi:hypothetical protein